MYNTATVIIIHGLLKFQSEISLNIDFFETGYWDEVWLWHSMKYIEIIQLVFSKMGI